MAEEKDSLADIQTVILQSAKWQNKGTNQGTIVAAMKYYLYKSPERSPREAEHRSLQGISPEPWAFYIKGTMCTKT